jgi:hypothetical protein
MMPLQVPCPSRIRWTGSVLLLAACIGTLQAMSAEELAFEKQRLQQQGELESAGRLAPVAVGTVPDPLLDHLVARGFDSPEALKAAYDAEWQHRRAGLFAVRTEGVSVSTVNPDPAEHARLKAQANAEWHANRPGSSGREVPFNDLCGSAEMITDGSWFYSTVEANREIGELVCDSWGSANAPDVWFRYVADCTGTTTFSLCNSDYDSNIHAWSACGGTLLACNEDFCGTNGFSAQLDLAVEAGEEYILQISGFDNQSGSGNLLVYSACNAPGNETCATAFPVGTGSIPFYTLPGPPDAGIACSNNGGADVWYVWTPACSGMATFSTCAGANFDTMLGIWDACGGTMLACNDDDCGLQSTIDLTVTGGTPYYIQVLGYNNQSGHGILTIDVNIPNDDCATATPISGAGSWNYCTAGAESDVINPCTSLASPDVWFEYTADCASLVSFTTCGASSTYDTVIGLFDACGGNPLACNDDYLEGAGYPCGVNSRVDRYMLQGEQVWVQMAGYYGGSGSSTLTVGTVCYNPPNDLCRLALPLHEGTTSFTTVGATTDGPVEVAICTNAGDSNLNSDIWYTYTPATSGVVTISLAGANYDTRMAVYAGTCPSAESAIACNDDYHGLQSQVEFAACAGQIYRVRIGGYTDSFGNTFTGSGPIALSLAPVDAPLAPQNLAIHPFGMDIYLTWDPVEANELGCALNNAFYIVMAGDANGNSWPALVTPYTSAYLPQEYQNNTIRTYRVIADTPDPRAASAGAVPVSFHGNSVMIDNGQLSK